MKLVHYSLIAARGKLAAPHHRSLDGRLGPLSSHPAEHASISQGLAPGAGHERHGEIMKNGTRLIFWIDVAVLLILCVLILMGQWDFVIALFVALVILNYFDRWRGRGQSKG